MHVIITRETVQEAALEEGISDQEVSDYYPQEGKTIRFIYSAIREQEGDFEHSAYIGVEYDDNTWWVYGLRFDREVGSYKNMINQLLAGF